MKPTHLTLALLAVFGTACAADTVGEVEARESAAPDLNPVSSEDESVLEQTRAPGTCSDTCAKKGGIDWQCKLRFMYGINYPWHHFGGDFGGIPAWNQPGISANSLVDGELATLKANGSSVIRWWVFPDFRGQGVQFDAQDRVVGLGGTALADLNKALELAEKHGLYLMLTLFSFDNFKLTRTEGGVKARGITPYAIDAAKRADLIQKVVRPFARAVGQSRYAHRMIAWDVINEPEWAMTGPSMYGGDEGFTARSDVAPLTHAQMETFLRDVIKPLQEETQSLISIGSAAVKWRNAWSKLDVDFHQFHIYDWVNDWWPYNKSPAALGVTDKPWVMGEFPLAGLENGTKYGTLVDSWYGNGYAGALGWAYKDNTKDGKLSDVKAFADKHKCEVTY